MVLTSDLRQILQQKLDSLPDTQLQAVLQFVNDLSVPTPESPENTNNQPNSDPLAEFIGAVHHGSLAQNIDRDLYG